MRLEPQPVAARTCQLGDLGVGLARGRAVTARSYAHGAPGTRGLAEIAACSAKVARTKEAPRPGLRSDPPREAARASSTGRRLAMTRLGTFGDRKWE